jgi:hypothetical protein
MKHYEKASCSTPKCGGSFDLIPPADPEYKISKEKSESDDNIERTYPCDKEKHQNTIPSIGIERNRYLSRVNILLQTITNLSGSFRVHSYKAFYQELKPIYFL